MTCAVCSFAGDSPSDHEPWCPCFMRGPVGVEGQTDLLEEIAKRIEAGDLLYDKSCSDREFLAPLLDDQEG